MGIRMERRDGDQSRTEMDIRVGMKMLVRREILLRREMLV